MTENEFAELAAGHALHALSPEDARAFEHERAAHPEWEIHVREAEETATLLADGVVPVAPPAGIRDALLAAVAQPAPTSVPPAPEPTAGPPGAVPARRRRGWFALAASLAGILVIALGATLVSTLTAPSAQQVALEQIENAPDAQSATVTLPDGGTATAHWSDSLGTAALETEGMAAAGDDLTYELWYVRGEDPLPAGTFDPDADGRSVATLEGDFVPGDVIAVTVEQAGGSPDGLPTSPPVIAIPT